MSEQTISFVKTVTAQFPDLRQPLEEHIKDNFGEILPHVFFGDIARYALSLLSTQHSRALPTKDEKSQSKLRDLLDYLEDAFSRGNDELRELIAVSFLENLPRPNEQGAQIREMVGPNLRKELETIG